MIKLFILNYPKISPTFSFNSLSISKMLFVPYKSMVVLYDKCPKTFWMTSKLSPLSFKIRAQLCRNMWGLIFFNSGMGLLKCAFWPAWATILLICVGVICYRVFKLETAGNRYPFLGLFSTYCI